MKQLEKADETLNSESVLKDASFLLHHYHLLRKNYSIKKKKNYNLIHISSSP